MAPIENGVGIYRNSALRASYDDGIERLCRVVEAAVQREWGWSARVSAGLAAGLDLLAADPDLARLLTVEASPELRPAHERSLQRLAKALRRPAAELPLGSAVTDETALLLAGGVVSHVSGRVLAGEAARLGESHDLLLDYVLTPSHTADERRAASS